MAEITMRRLLKAGAHFGHQTRYWAPKMAPYIFGDRDKIHIINLEKTLPMLQEAMKYLGGVAAGGGKILFVGTKRQAGKPLREHAILCGCPYVDHRWLGGMLTNYKTVKNSITRLKELEQLVESGGTVGLNKKEALNLERERTKLDRTLSGIKDMNGLPDALFVIDVEQEYIAVAEANKLNIPVVAVVDTNCSPDGIDYIIPGNDDSARSIMLYLEAAVDSITEARASGAVAVVGGEDEYIEVDESGEVIKKSVREETGSKAPGVKGAGAKAVEAKTAEGKQAAAEKIKIQPAETPEAEKAADAAVAVPDEGAAEAEGGAGDGADAEAEKPADTTKKVIHKKAPRKKVVRKTASKKKIVLKTKPAKAE